MPAEVVDLARYRLEKAPEDLMISQTMLTEGHYATSINRSYYSMFQRCHAVWIRKRGQATFPAFSTISSRRY